jgi:hypothetical protein
LIGERIEVINSKSTTRFPGGNMRKKNSRAGRGAKSARKVSMKSSPVKARSSRSAAKKTGRSSARSASSRTSAEGLGRDSSLVSASQVIPSDYRKMEQNPSEETRETRRADKMKTTLRRNPGNHGARSW